jgi:hypothetical protein
MFTYSEPTPAILAAMFATLRAMAGAGSAVGENAAFFAARSNIRGRLNAAGYVEFVHTTTANGRVPAWVLTNAGRTKSRDSVHITYKYV